MSSLFLVEEASLSRFPRRQPAHLDFGAQGLVRLAASSAVRASTRNLKAVVRVAQAPRELRDLEVYADPRPDLLSRLKGLVT